MDEPSNHLPHSHLPHSRLPSGAVASAWTTFVLHPPADYDLNCRTGRYVAVLPFSTALCAFAAGDGAMRRTRLRAGTLWWFEPGTRLHARRIEPVEFLVLSIDPRRPPTVAGDIWRPRTVTDLHDPAVAALGQEMRRSLLADHLSAPAYLQALADALVVRLACVFLGETEEGRRGGHGGGNGGEALSPGTLARVVRHIDAHLDAHIRVEDLAALAGLSRSHFSRAFQRMTGEPPQRFIMGRRVCRARDLLSASGMPIAEVAARAGFASQAHLSTAFRHQVGTTPKRYRQAFTGHRQKETDTAEA